MCNRCIKHEFRAMLVALRFHVIDPAHEFLVIPVFIRILSPWIARGIIPLSADMVRFFIYSYVVALASSDSRSLQAGDPGAGHEDLSFNVSFWEAIISPFTLAL